MRAATRADPMFAEAWYNLSDLLDEQGRSEAAIDCLRKTLRAPPAYIDAIFNLALLLQRSNKHAEAAEYWRQLHRQRCSIRMGGPCAAVLKVLRNADPSVGLFLGDNAMAHGIFRTVVAIMLNLPLVAIAYSEAPAQERATCSQARSSCGKQPVCQRRHDACIETGCWTVGLIKRCGYEKR